MKHSIAFFDFDGTITSKDTLFEIIKFHKGKTSYLIGLLKLLPWLIAMKLRFISNSSAKEKVLTLFFKNTTFQEFQSKCDIFISDKLPALIRTEALKEIEKHKQNDVTVVVVSASAENWVEGWCRLNQIQCLATRLEVKEGLITGRIEGRNCNGEEKVRRIKEHFSLDKYQNIWAYGDTKGDKPMLSLAAYPNYKPFRKKATR